MLMTILKVAGVIVGGTAVTATGSYIAEKATRKTRVKDSIDAALEHVGSKEGKEAIVKFAREVVSLQDLLENAVKESTKGKEKSK